MGRSSLVALALAITATACTPGGPTTGQSSPTAAPCGVSALQLGPEALGPYGFARAGPLWFSAFGRVSPGAPAVLEPGGGPYDGWKVVIAPDPAATGGARLSGSECGSSKVVRFCYAQTGCDYSSRLTSSVVILDVDVDRHLDYTGYMVFPGPGLMRLIVSDSRGTKSSVVIRVPEVQGQ